MKISVIVPVYNEEADIAACIVSLLKQSNKDFEIIVVDDGSSDNTLGILSKFKVKNSKLRVLVQQHLGPGKARNLGANKARGEILVFVDSDMIFDRDFLSNLTRPVMEKGVVGTFSKEEYVLNHNNAWSKCWSINRQSLLSAKNLQFNKMHPDNYPDEQAVFRAILKKEFKRVGGFTAIGYVDDHTLSEKLGIMAVVAPGAVFYHKSPASIKEVFKQARWIGKSEYKRRKVKNEPIMRVFSMVRYSLPFSLVNGIYKSVKFNLWKFLLFKIIYDFAIEVSLIGSFFGEQKYR